MPGIGKAFLNDNIRTAHLKCESCRTQVFLVKIERCEDGGENRSFGCPHCALTHTLRVAPPRDRQIARELAIANEHSGA